MLLEGKRFVTTACSRAMILMIALLAGALVCAAQERPVFKVAEKGRHWQLTKFSGTMEGRKFTDEELYYIVGFGGIAEAPIPNVIREALEADARDSRGLDVVYVVHKKSAEQVAAEALQSRRKLGDDCFGWKSLTRSAELSVSTPETLFSITIANDPGDNEYYSGSLKVGFPMKGNVTGSATIGVYYSLCVPVAIKFKEAAASGKLGVISSLNVDIQFHAVRDFTHQLVEIPLGGIAFAVGPIPVYIGFSAFVDAVLHMESPNLIQVRYGAVGRGSGNIDYSCSLNGCSGSSTFTHSFHQSGDISFVADGARGIIKPYLFGGVQVFLYEDALAHARIGVAPYVQGDFWAFAGGGCGDANGDGHHEYVRALTADLDAGVDVRAKVAVPPLGSWAQWEGVLHSWEKHLEFFDFIGSNALQPVVIGNSIAHPDSPKTLKFRMRPCYPYNDDVSFEVNWGDGAQNSYFWGSPGQENPSSHTWAAKGFYTLSVSPLFDVHGRHYSATTNRSIYVVGPIPIPELPQ